MPREKVTKKSVETKYLILVRSTCALKDFCWKKIVLLIENALMQNSDADEFAVRVRNSTKSNLFRVI